MMPTTRPPHASAASAVAPIRPTRPPPYTNPIPRRANIMPTTCAASTYEGFAPWEDPQKMQI